MTEDSLLSSGIDSATGTRKSSLAVVLADCGVKEDSLVEALVALGEGKKDKESFLSTLIFHRNKLKNCSPFEISSLQQPHTLLCCFRTT